MSFTSEAKRQIESGRIGEVRHLTCQLAGITLEVVRGHEPSFVKDAFIKPALDTWSDPQKGGGYGYGQTTHLLGLVLWITGLEASEVFAMMGASPTQVDLFHAISARLSNGATAMISGAAASFDYQFDVRIFGTEGMLLLSFWLSVIIRVSMLVGRKIRTLFWAVALLLLPTRGLAAPTRLSFVQEEQQRKQEEQQRKEEKVDHFSKWLKEDVVYIITPEERSVFEKLSTDVEKENFIEQFWRRRDTDSATAFNEFQAEHYRRVAYANEQFRNAGISGWKTDRGRVYITFGPPTSTDRYGAGANYHRDLDEGGGTTKVYAMEKWFYNHIEGIDSGVEIEFVDRSSTGDYRIALRPEEKDALLMMTGGGPTLFEQLGLETRAARVRSMDLMRPIGGDDDVYGRAGDNPFLRVERYFQLQKPPEIKFNDLKAKVTARVTYNQFPVSAVNSYSQLNEASFLAPITIFIPLSELTYQPLTENRERATVHIYGSLTSPGGRIVREFEETIYDDRPTGRVGPIEHKRYQKVISLPSGLYKLNLVLKDAHSERFGYVEQKLDLPTRVVDELSLSSLLLSDLITPAKDGSFPDPFVTALGWKVYPASNNRFHTGERLGLYFEVYDFTLDSAISYPDLEILAVIKDGQGQILAEGPDQFLFEVLADRVATAFLFSLQGVKAGHYTLELMVEDLIQQKKVARKTRFQVILAES